MATVSYGTITITDTNDIEQIYMVYAGSSSDTQAPDKTNFSLWKTDITQVTGTYIWQRTVIKKSGINIDSSNFQNYYGEPVCVTGPEGTAARKITSVVPYYYLSTSSSNQTGGSWSTTPTAYPASGTYYYWTKTITTYDSGSPSESTPVLDKALNSANETARAANTTANNAKSKADTVEGNLNNYMASNDSALSALQTKTKYFWTNLVAHTRGSGGWTKPNYPVGTYAASGISGTNFDAEDSSTYGYNTLYSNGIKFRYNAINLSELTGSSLIFYRPSTTTQGTKGMELDSSSLNFYDSTGSVAQATFGGTQATISGTINAYDGKIGKGAAAWTIGNDSSSGKAMIYTGTRGGADSAYLSTGIGTESIGGSGVLNTTNDGYWTITAGANFGVTTKGKVYASSGKIGGWNLESNRLSIGTWGSDNSAMLCSGSSGAKSIGGSPSNISDWVFTAGSNFGVTKSGDLYCGNLNATGGSFTGALTATSLTVAPGATFDGDIDQFKGASFGWNLLLGTATPVTWTVTLNSSNYATKDCYKTITPVPSLFAVGDLVTISFDWQTDATGGNFHVECGNVTPYTWGNVVKAEGGRSSTSSYVDISSTNQSGHFIVTYRITDAQTGAAQGLQWLRIRVDGADTNGKSFTISNAKAERGSTASDWCTAESEIHGIDGLDGISASGLGMKVNYSTFTGASGGECYFHGYNDQNEEADVDGWVMWNGEKLTITKGMWINPNGVPPTNTPILHVFRTSTSPYHADVWWDSNLLRWTGYMYKSASDKTPSTKVSWTWNEATDCILATYVTTANEEISGAQLFNPPKKFSEISNPSDLFSMGVTLGSSGNMLLDTYARDLTKVNAKYNRYFSDASNTSTTASFVSAGNEVLPDPNAKYFVRIKNTVVYNSSATDRGLKALTFYNSGDYVNGIGMVVGGTYRASCWVRQLEGSSNFAIGLGGLTNSANYMDCTFVPSTEWQKYEKVFTFSDYKNTTTTWSRLYFENLAGFSINGAGTGIGQIDMCGFKLERINAIASSGRNLCLRSADYNGWGGSNGTTFSGNIITFPTVTANTWREAWQKSNLLYSVLRNQMITITYKVKGTAGNLIGASVGLALTASETSDVRLKYVNKFCNITATGEWQTIAMSAYINDYVFNSGTGTPDYDNCYFNVRVGAIGNAECRNGFQMKEVMVALGSDPCAWSPAPEDGVAYTDESIDAIEIGGKNLHKHSEKLDTGWATEQATIDKNTGIATLTRAGSGSCRIYQSPGSAYWTWEEGVEYTVSVEARASENGVILSFDCNSSGTITYDNNRRPTLTTEWKRYSCTFSISGTTSGGSMTYSMSTSATGKTIYLRKPMLERGNKPSDWSPAPEDLTQYFWVDGTGAHVGTVENNGDSGYNSLWSSTQGLLFRNGTTNLLKVFSNAITFFNSSSKKLLEITGSAINFYNTSTVKMMEITSNAINFFNSSGQKLVEFGTSALRFFYNGNEKAVFGSNIELKNGNMLMRLTSEALKFLIGSTVDDEIVYDERVSFGSEVAMKSARTFISTGMEDGYYSQNFMDIKPDGIQLKQIVDGSVEEDVNGTFISNITGQGIKPNNTRFILGDGVYGESGTHLWYTGDNLENGILTNADDDGEGMLFIAGWVTGSGKELMFTIPLCAPIAKGWGIDKGEYFENSNLSLTVTVRQNNHYLLGSGSAGVEIPRNATEWGEIDLVPCPSGISVHYYSTTAFPNVTNNDACGIKVGYNIPLIEEPDSSNEEMM